MESDEPSEWEAELGPKQAEFRASKRDCCSYGCLGMICLGIGIAGLVAIVVALFSGPQRGLLKLFVGSVLFIAGGVALLKGSTGASRTRVEVFEGGLVLHEGADTIGCRWTEIDTIIEKEAVDAGEVVNEGMENETRAFRLHLSSGQLIVLKSYISGLAQLGLTVQQRALPHLMSRCKQQLDTNRGVEFGPVLVTPEDIGVQGQAKQWSEIGPVHRKGGWIIISNPSGWGSWKKVKLSEVPNVYVMLKLIKELRGLG